MIAKSTHCHLRFSVLRPVLNMVGGFVIKITYKKSATHERTTIKTIENETTRTNGSILCQCCCIAGFGLKQFLQNKLSACQITPLQESAFQKRFSYISVRSSAGSVLGAR